MQPEPSRFIPTQVAIPQKRSRFAAFFAALWAWLTSAREEGQVLQREYDRADFIREQEQARDAEVEALAAGKQQAAADLPARPPDPGGSRYLHPKRSRFITGKLATPPAPFSRFYGMPAAGGLPVRSRFFTPPPELRPPGILHSRFIPNTPAPVSKFLLSKFLPPAAGVTPPEDDPPPTPPTIPPSRRKLHALWMAKNFRKPFP